jgi:hypothetical protein
VLHTRISEELAEDIRRMAEDLRVPVSNIVRNVLEEAFSVVETVTENVGDLIEDVIDEAEAAAERIRVRKRERTRSHAYAPEPPEPPAPPAPPAPPDGVIGWQALILAQPQACDACARPLERGASAYAGVTRHGVGDIWRCADCLLGRE